MASRVRAVRRNIPEPERLKVWVRSGGCCAACGRYLLEGVITHRAFPLGDLAHIVGQLDTAGSPRGQVVEMTAEDRDSADNLLLRCPGEHREIDRTGAVEIMDIERLQRLKRDHEEWIKRVVSLIAVAAQPSFEWSVAFEGVRLRSRDQRLPTRSFGSTSASPTSR